MLTFQALQAWTTCLKMEIKVKETIKIYTMKGM